MNSFTKAQFWALVALRVIIGWHFLYEGIVKLENPNWTSLGYLTDSGGMFKGFFNFLAYSPQVLEIVDQLNIWGLIAIGIGLITGTFSRYAMMGGILLLGFYYLSHPPFVGLSYSLPMEGSYLIVNKVLIELVSLVVLLFFPTSNEIGIDRFILTPKVIKKNID